MANHRKTPREFFSDFIDMYRSFPCLWKLKSDEYSDRRKRDQAYAKLVEKYKEFDPSADRTVVVKKISSLRTVYNKEKAKVTNSLESGAGSEEVYKPTLWYYDLMHFLYDQDAVRSVSSTMDDEESDNPSTAQPKSQSQIDQRPNDHPISNDVDYEKTHIIETNGIKRRKLSNDDYRPKPANEVLKPLQYYYVPNSINSSNHYESFGKYVADCLNKMDSQSGAIAKKLMSDVIFEGEMDRLSETTQICQGHTSKM